MVFDNSEVPILTTKRVAWKSAIHELLWFYVHRTSDVAYLRENNVKIWEEWTRNDNTIGKAYGYQLGKMIKHGKPMYLLPSVVSSPFFEERDLWYQHDNQVNIFINGLIENPASRRHVLSLWNIDDLYDMSLFPCFWSVQGIVKERKLHLIVQARSNDVGLGQSFNFFQYHVLQRMICQVTGYQIGTLTFNVNDMHIYERHLEPLKEQIELTPYDAPELWINPEVKNFDDFTIDDFKLIEYQHHPSIKMEVAL